ncbi:phage head spike fiber domain-containing protein [Cupriavidus numazuensis]|uniref:Uncharacterized protein n=1 Tax=Cupriavidus numazuensis TaxID=221992 RepID=A0ABN7PRA4_9BURK|nr:hypothetical protein [Cupriavidus numazuensis]CAG2129087.1 hypothetical protein LMG26411_00115 [Cupriavidus numazuensis]
MYANKNLTDIATATRSTARWRYDASGILVQDASNVFQPGYDPLTLEKLGVPIEEQRTNVLLQSEDLTVTGNWPRTRVAVAASGGMFKVTEDASNNTHYFGQFNQTVGADGIAVTSFLAKAGERDRLTVEFVSEVGSSGLRAGFDLSAGTVTLQQGIGTTNGTGSAGMVSRGGGVYFCWIIATPGTTGNTKRSAIFYIGNGGSTSYQGDGVSGLFLAKPQLEAGPFPTSYIPTTTAQATRAADSVIASNIAQWFNPSEGTMYVEAVANRAASVLQGGSSPRLFQFYNSGNVGESLAMYRRATDNLIGASVSTGGAGYPVAGAAIPDGAVFRAAFAYKAGDCALSMNGGAALALSSSLPTGIDRLAIGSTGAGAGAWAGHLRPLRYIPRRLSNADLQALTVKGDPGFTLNFDFGAKTYFMGLA